MKRELVRQGRMVSRKDQKHLAELDQELDLAEVIAAGASNQRLPASAASGEPRR